MKIAGLDMSRVRSVAGDLGSGQLAQAMHDALAPAAIARAYLEHAAGRPTIAFLPNVALSREQADVFREHGVRAVHVDGDSSDDERDLALKQFRAGDIDVLCNCSLFTEGTDLPTTACIILGRPTKSAELYQQMVGRGLRLAPGKTDCIVLDVTGVTGRHKLATIASLNGAEGDDGEPIPDDLLMYEQDDLAETVADATPLPEDDGPHGADGPLEHELVDLFGQQNAAWQRTDGGTWFLATPPAIIYLEPADDGLWNVRYAARALPGRAGPSVPTGMLVDGLELGYAMAWGDQYVESVPQWGLERDAAWRAKPTRSGLTRGQVADQKAQREASRLLDDA